MSSQLQVSISNPSQIKTHTWNNISSSEVFGAILCNNPPLKTSKFPTFLGEPFCSPVPPRSFIFPPVFLAPPLNYGIDSFLSLDFFCFEISFFSSCPVWPRIAPTASTNQVLRFNGVFWAYLTGFRPLKSSPRPFSPEAAAPDTFFLVLCGPAGLPDIRVDLGFPAATRASPYTVGVSPGPKEEDREEDPTEGLKEAQAGPPPRHPNQKRESQDFPSRPPKKLLAFVRGSGFRGRRVTFLLVWMLPPRPWPAYRQAHARGCGPRTALCCPYTQCP